MTLRVHTVYKIVYFKLTHVWYLQHLLLLKSYIVNLYEYMEFIFIHSPLICVFKLCLYAYICLKYLE